MASLTDVHVRWIVESAGELVNKPVIGIKHAVAVSVVNATVDSEVEVNAEHTVLILHS